MLERFIYGVPIDENGDAETSEAPSAAAESHEQQAAPLTNGLPRLELLAHSSGLTEDDAAVGRGLVSLQPVAASSTPDTLSVGVFPASNDRFILARAYYQDGDTDRPIYHYAVVPREVLQTMAGSIRSFIEQIDDTRPIPQTRNQTIPPLDIPPTPTWTADKRTLLFNKLVDAYGDMTILFRLLGAALDERGLLIRGLAKSTNERLDLIQGLIMLLPAAARPDITFATHVNNPDSARVRIAYSNHDHGAVETQRWVADLEASEYPDDTVLEKPYIKALTGLWHGDIKAFVAELRAMEIMASQIMPGAGSLEDGLTQLASRHTLDMQVLSDADVPFEQVQDILASDPPPPGPLRVRYAERLLHGILDHRDTDAVALLAALSDEDEELDAAMSNVLDTALHEEPDAVYFFIRTRLAGDADEKWLPRLANAAIESLQVAVDDGDNATLMSWLRLIAREPATYQLGSVLQEGITAAQNRAHNDGELGVQLVMFAVKRAPAAIDTLLDDEALVAALDAPLGPALRDYEPDATAAVLASGPEIGLALLGRAAANAGDNPPAAAVFSPDTIDYLWALYLEETDYGVPPHYQPETIVQTLSTTAAPYLSDDGLVRLMARAAAEEQAELFERIGSAIATRETSALIFTEALLDSEVPANAALNLVGQLSGSETITQQQAINIYLQLTDRLSWSEQTLPLVAQVARILQHTTTLQVSPAVLWAMLQIGQSEKDELVTRVAVRRLLVTLQNNAADNEVVDTLVRLHERIQWSATARQHLNAWWRDYLQAQPLTRLQQFDRLTEGKRGLDDIRGILQTAIAIRRMLGKRTLEEFADAISTSYSILQALSDSFDPDTKHAIEFDQPTLRAEIDARSEELTPDERNVLAKNLRELAGLVITMAENRSKSSLIRREDNIERQLLRGEQQPQSAIDTMKWLSGFLTGMQDKPNDGG
jgi:hypothetical protein